MKEPKDKNVTRGIQLLNNKPEISHLLYADNVIFLGSWSPNYIRNLIEILWYFKLSYNLKVNLSKSKITGFGDLNLKFDLLASRIDYLSVPFHSHT